MLGVEDPFVLAGKSWRSRLIVGTGKYKDEEETRRALTASGAEIVTVALRRIELKPGQPSLLDALAGYAILPNTAGCYTVEEAVRTARLARELGMTEFVKLEVIGDKRTLFPDAEATLEAARVLVKEGFVVLPYTNDDPVMAKKLEDAGCAAVMPLAAPIGSGLGIRNPYNLRIIMETVKVPVIVRSFFFAPSGSVKICGGATEPSAKPRFELPSHGAARSTCTRRTGAAP